MKKFFNYVKSNFFWILLYVFLSFLFCVMCFSFLDMCFYSCVEDYYCIFSLSAFIPSLPIIPQFIICFIFLKLSNSWLLWVYSYKLYFGKNNWYKFYNECEKLHKIEDKKLYKKYLNGDISINDIKFIYTVKEDFFNEKFK